MRPIHVSTDVFQAIWLARVEGEETEDEILRRIFELARPAPAKSKPQQAEVQGASWTEKMYGISFPSGFRIFRNYKGKNLEAVVQDGHWFGNGKQILADTMNKVSEAFGIKGENAWMGWEFEDEDGPRKISELRDSDIIRKRHRFDLTTIKDVDIKL